MMAAHTRRRNTHARTHVTRNRAYQIELEKLYADQLLLIEARLLLILNVVCLK